MTSQLGLRTTIVVPAFNEAARLPALFAQIRDHVDLDRTEVIIVDDGSTDETSRVAESFATSLPSAQVHRQASNMGKGRAIAAGIQRSKGERVVFMDADSATDLSGLDSLLAALDQFDIAIGSRSHPDSVVEHAHQHRAVMGRAFNQLTRSVTGLTFRDTQCGFKGFRGPVARLLFSMSDVDGFAFDVAVLSYAHRLGFSITEVPITWRHVPGSKIRRIVDPFRMATDAVRAAVLPRHQFIDAVRISGFDRPEVRATIAEADPPLQVSAGPDRVDVLIPPGEEPAYAEFVDELRAGDIEIEHVVHDSVALLRRGHGTGLGTRPPAIDVPQADEVTRALQVRYAGRRVLRHGKNLMGLHPATLPILLRLTPTGTTRRIEADTELVVEGFPRSGNTFTSFALKHANPSLRMVSHVHHPSQVKLAVARGVPTVVVVREPIATLASYLIAGPHGRTGAVLREYISYHHELLSVASNVLVVDFDEITSDMGEVSRMITERFGLELKPFDHQPDQVEAVYRAIERHHDELHGINEGLMARPSTVRRGLNAQHRLDLQGPEHRAELDRARRLHKLLLALSRR